MQLCGLGRKIEIRSLPRSIRYNNAQQAEPLSHLASFLVLFCLRQHFQSGVFIVALQLFPRKRISHGQDLTLQINNNATHMSSSRRFPSGKFSFSCGGPSQVGFLAASQGSQNHRSRRGVCAGLPTQRSLSVCSSRSMASITVR